MALTIEASVTWVSLACTVKAQSNASMAKRPVPVFSWLFLSECRRASVARLYHGITRPSIFSEVLVRALSRRGREF